MQLKNTVEEQTIDLHITLKKNRRLLKSLLEQVNEEPIVDKRTLEKAGFNFMYVGSTNPAEAIYSNFFHPKQFISITTTIVLPVSLS